MVTIIKQIHNQVQKIIEEKFGNSNSYYYHLYNQAYEKIRDDTIPIQNDMAILIMPIDFTKNQANQYLALIHHFINKEHNFRHNGVHLYHIIKDYTKLVVTAMNDEFYANKLRGDMFYYPIYQRYRILYSDKYDIRYASPRIYF